MSKFKLEKTEEQWKDELGKEAYHVLREKGTEAPFSGDLNSHFSDGKYYCKGCNTELFSSDNKFDSGCGWPSFDASKPGNIIYEKDTSFGRIRTEIMCGNCGGHLGHVFDDGPTETGQRYCVNSLSIDFKKS